MIKLMDLVNEGLKEKAAELFLRNLIKGTKWQGKVYIAGGYPRDELLGNDPKDLDLLVNFPNGGIKFSEWVTKKLGVYKKGKNPVIYPRFGTAQFRLVGVKYKGQDLSDLEIEAVMPRKEKYIPGSRKPVVSQGTLKDDVERRDFLVNSLLKDLSTGEILDLTGMGKSDLKKGLIRTPLDPDVIFSEDPLRMLRAIRFTVKYDWDLPLFMIRAIKKNARLIKTISSERIRDELNKMIVTKVPHKAVKLLQITNLGKYVLPELEVLRGMKQNKYHKHDVMKHSLEVLKQTPPDLITRLAALFHDIGKGTTKSVIDHEVHFYQHEKIGADMTREIMKRLAYPNDVIDAVVTSVKNHMKTKQYGKQAELVTDKSLRKLKSKLGKHLERTLDIIHADNISHGDGYNMPDQIPSVRQRLKKLDQEPDKPNLPINGQDIIKMFNLKPGPIIGQLLKVVEDAWYDNPKISKAEAKKLVRIAYKSIQN